MAARRAVHDRQLLLFLDRPARERPLLEGTCAYLGRRAYLRQGPGLYVYVARADRRHAVEGRPHGRSKARRLRAGRHGVGRSEERRVGKEWRSGWGRY